MWNEERLDRIRQCLLWAIIASIPLSFFEVLVYAYWDVRPAILETGASLLVHLVNLSFFTVLAWQFRNWWMRRPRSE